MKHAASRLLTRQDSCDWTGLDSTRLCWCVRSVAAAIVSKPQNHSRVFVSLSGLDWTRLDSVGVYAPLGKRSGEGSYCELALKTAIFVTVYLGFGCIYSSPTVSSRKMASACSYETLLSVHKAVGCPTQKTKVLHTVRINIL
jgi:hypothetical protein